MSDEINRINPTVVEGAEDIHGAETFDADYSPLNRPSFSWRDNMAQSRRTLDKKQVGDMVKMRRMGRGRFDAQGYNDRMDESMGMSRKETKMEQSMKDRRDESKGMEKGMGRRAYQRVGTMDAESIGSIIGNLIPEPHFIGFEEIRQEKMKNQNTKDAQGYDDKLDESMGMSNRESSMKQSMKDRRDESKGMEKGMGRRAYQRVGTMDAESCGNCGNSLVMNAEGEHGCGCGTEMEAEETMLGSIGEGNDFGQMEAETFGAERSDDGIVYVDEDNSIRLAKGSNWMKGIGGIEEHYVEGCMSCHEELDGYRTKYVVSPSERWAYCMECFDEMKGRDDVIINDAETFGAERRYRYGNRYITRDSKGRFKKNVDVGRSLSADRRQKAKIVKGVGQGGSGDYKAESFSADILYDAKIRLKNPKDAKYITPSIEDGMEFGEGEGVLSSRVKTDSEAEGFGAEEYKHCDGCEEVRSIDEFSLSNDPEQTLTEGEVCDYCFGDTYYGAEGFNTEETMLGSIGEGNDFGQMEAEGDVVDLTQGVLAKGGVRVGGMTASAIVLAIAGMSGYYYARR